MRVHLGISVILGLLCGVHGAPFNARADSDVYQIGVGIYDITGPAAQVNMMGYSYISQTASGIHLREYSRAFIIGDNQTRVVFVSIDAGMVDTAVTTEVVRQLREIYGELYTEKNLCISGTHTHSGAAGFFQYLLFDVTSLGFVQGTFDAMVTGIVQSIVRAHNSVKSGYILYNRGELTDASINRSPTSYQYNPEEEKAKYEYDTDKDMFLLKFVDFDGNHIGMLNWFAVHGTSMNNTNGYLSSDNKGLASILFEDQYNPAGTFPGKGPYVSAFAQTNEGDSTPNTAGPRCIDTGLPCDANTSTCNGFNENCIAFGPGKDMFESTYIIANKQLNKANELYSSAITRLHGPVSFIHQHIDMENYTFDLDGVNVTTCQAAMGFSFAAGTIDGPGALDFHQGTPQGTQNDIWNQVRNILQRPTQDLLDCHYPKAVLLPVGQMNRPYEWTPKIIPTQILKIGNLAILAVPGEFTTMSGRRLRDGVFQAFQDNGGNPGGDLQVVISGLSNIYTNYITTFEEYQPQRYEAASTLFGPHTLQAYINQFQYLAANLAQGRTVPPGEDPPNLMDQQFSLLADVEFETTPPGTKFGDVWEDVQGQYTPGAIVTVSFVCGNPRNDLKTDDTFLTVELWDTVAEDWTVVANDALWETKFKWTEYNSFFHQSICIIDWEIPSDAAIGDYRIRHFGAYKVLFGGIYPYEGTSSTFKVNVGRPISYFAKYHNY